MDKKIFEDNDLLKDHAKRKNILFFGLILAFMSVLFASFLSFYFDTKEQFKQSKKEEAVKDKKEIITDKEFKESWALSVENRFDEIANLVKDELKNLKKDINETVNRQNEKLDQSISDIKQEIQINTATTESKINEITKEIENIKNKVQEIEKKEKEKEKEVKIDELLLPPPPLENAGAESREGLLPPPPSQIKTGELKIKDEKKEKELKIVEFKNESILKKFESQDKNETLEEKAEAEPAKYDIATGFTKAYMITGAYAPLFGNSSQHAIPVLLEAEGNIIASNNTEESIDKCFLIGTAIGNPSSDTIDIRLSTMECLIDDGKKRLRGNIQGWVIGENGMPGISATLIFKSGKYISRLIAAGAMETFANVLVKASQPDYDQPTTNVITDGAANAFATGTGNAFSKLADFYMKWAEKTLPVLESKGGRFVTLFLKGGDSFTVEKFNKLNVEDVDEYLEEED